MYSNTMFHYQIVCLFFLTSTAYSAKLAEETGTTLEQFSESDTHRNRRDVETMSNRSILTVGNGGDFGGWGRFQLCSSGAYAVAYDLKIESYQGYRGDDTALNGIKLFCEFPDGRRDLEITSFEGPWGDWQGSYSCGREHFLIGFRLQVEEYLGRGASEDDTSANFVQFKCRDLEGYEQEYKIKIPPGEGHWGDYGPWSMPCPNGQAICGLRTKVEGSCGGDDTALNDVEFYCCD